jgi:GNAT superfamily N-acetyltransferase
MSAENQPPIPLDESPAVEGAQVVFLQKITAENLSTAVSSAREIFPNEQHGDVFWPEGAYERSIANQDPKFAYYLAVNTSGDVVGITGHYSQEDELWLGWFGVRPAFRRQGFAKAIIRATADIFMSFGSPTLKLWSGDREEYSVSHRMYIRLGFELERQGVVEGEPVLYFTAKLPLPPPTPTL